MATNDQYRVTKDKSARKNTKEQDMVSADEHAAILEGKEAYINRIKSGHAAKIEAWEADHAALLAQHTALEAEYAALKTKHASLETQAAGLENKQKATQAEITQQLAEAKAQIARSDTLSRQNRDHAVNAAVTRCQQETDRTMRNLRAENTRLEGAIKGEFEAKQAELSAANAEIARLKDDMTVIVQKNDKEEKELQTRINTLINRLKRSWIEIHFDGKNRKTRTYYRKPNCKLSEAAKELCEDLKADIKNMAFRSESLPANQGGTAAFSVLKASVNSLDINKTLEELGIKEGTTIRYTRS